MKKRKKGRKFNRTKDQRKAFLLSLINNLFLKEKIKTTEARAKEISGLAEKYITKAKKMNLSTRKNLFKDLSKRAVTKLEKEIVPNCKDRKGGYTRIIKVGPRDSDSAKMAIIELVK
jgi:large subunit ribosomal protein L17